MSERISTANDIASWMRLQNRPKPPKRTLLVLRPTTSDALKEFSLQYNRLIKQNINSRTAYALYLSVSKAEVAKDLIGRISQKVRDSTPVQDALSGLQLSVFAAGNWIRRFADDRHKEGEWIMIEERQAGRELAGEIDFQVKQLFAKIEEKTTARTVLQAFEAYNIKWKEDERQAESQAEKDNKFYVETLQREFVKVEKLDSSAASVKTKFMLSAYCAELEDSKKELTPAQKTVVNNVMAWLKPAEKPAPAWRTQGIKTLGPFGIAADIQINMSIEFPMGKEENEKINGKYVITGPKDDVAIYQKGLGGEVTGMLSPVFAITIKQSDPVAALIRIPLNAAFFAFAYPVITHELEVQVVKKTHLDAFLLFGGFVYFDKDMNIIRCNGLWIGCQLQMSAPKELPPNVAKELKESGRFRDITLPQLSAAKAKQFAWILPNEFRELNLPHGGWGYLYDDESANNYFSIAAAESVRGLTKAFSLRDIPSE